LFFGLNEFQQYVAEGDIIGRARERRSDVMLDNTVLSFEMFGRDIESDQLDWFV